MPARRLPRWTLPSFLAGMGLGSIIGLLALAVLAAWLLAS